MKKIYAFYTACLVVLFSFSLTGQNLLINPSFESGILAPWTPGNNNVVTIVADAQSGDFAANGNIEQIVKMEAGKNYTYSCYVKTSTPDINVWIGVKDLVGDALVKNFKFDWTDYGLATIDFEAPSSGDHRFWVWGQGDADYTSDNFVLLLEGTTTNLFDVDAGEQIIINTQNSGVMVQLGTYIQDAQISVHDMSGRIVYQADGIQGDNFINENTFATSGTYVVAVRAGAFNRSTKVVMVK